MDIDDWREKIDKLDGKLLVLLNKRAVCALEIGKIKQATGQPVYVPDRESAVIDYLRDLNAGPLSDGAIQRIFRRIIDESRCLEQERGKDGIELEEI